MTTDAIPSYFPSMPPTFGWRRVVELAEEFKMSSTDMMATCERLGVVVADASEWLDPESVDLIRESVAANTRAAVLTLNKPKALKTPRPPKAEKAPRLPKPPKAHKEPKPQKAPKAPKVQKALAPDASPPLASVSRDGVRTGRVVLIGLAIALFAGVAGIVVDRWVDYVTNTDAPATVVTTDES
jgi:hypothetical protein